MKSIPQLFDLTGKGAIVTGGAQGIGKGIALRLSEAGAGVMISGRNMDTARQTVEEIRAAGGEAVAVRTDAGKIADIQKAVDATCEAFGSVDILINNLGIRSFATVSNISEEMWDNVLNINLKSMFFFCRAASRQMIKAGNGGKIINISSLGALSPHGTCAHYDTSKGGVITLTKALALEFAPYNIQVNAIAPGGTMTPGVMKDYGELRKVEEELGSQLVNIWTVKVPWHRYAEPDDTAKVALFLASGASDYMTGVLLPVDGGRWLL